MSEKRFYICAPPWSLHEVLCTLSERFLREKKHIADIAKNFAKVVFACYKTFTKKEGNREIMYKKLTLSSPETFMNLYNDSKKLLALIKDCCPHSEVLSDACNLLEIMMKDLKDDSLDNEIDEISKLGLTNEATDNLNENYLEELTENANIDKHMQVLQYLKKNFDAWKNYDLGDEISTGNKDAPEITKKVSPIVNKKSTETEPIKKGDDKNVPVGPVIIRNFNVKIPEFESKLSKLDDLDLDYEDYDAYVENNIGEYDEHNVEFDENDTEHYGEHNLGEFDEDNVEEYGENNAGEYNEKNIDEYDETDENYVLKNKECPNDDHVEANTSKEKSCLFNKDSDTNSVSNVNTIKDADTFLEDEIDYEYDEIIDKNEMGPPFDEYFDQSNENYGYDEICKTGTAPQLDEHHDIMSQQTEKKLCPVAHSIERCITNCFAFASKQFETRLGLKAPEHLEGEAAGLPKLPEILETIQIFSQCLEELLNSRTCDVRLLRVNINKLSPNINVLPKHDKDLLRKSVRFVEKVPSQSLKKEIAFLQETQSILRRFFQDYC